VTGSGSGIISGSGTLEYGAASAEDTIFADGASGTLRLDHAASFTGSISGFGAGDSLDLGDIGFSDAVTIGFAENGAGTGGMLSLSDGTHSANIALQGQYGAAGFQSSADQAGGTILTYADPMKVA